MHIRKLVLRNHKLVLHIRMRTCRNRACLAIHSPWLRNHKLVLHIRMLGLRSHKLVRTMEYHIRCHNSCCDCHSP